VYKYTLGMLYSKRAAQGAKATELEVPTLLMKPEQLRNAVLETPDNMKEEAE
jgi:hypothetical protein